MNEKRSRGRPVGSGGKSDSKYLHQVADIIVGNPKMKPTSAMRQVIGKQAGAVDANSDAAMLRRMQHKWKRDAATYMAAAQERATRAFTPSSNRNALEVLQELDETIRRLVEPPAGVKAFVEQQRLLTERINELTAPLRQFREAMAWERNSEFFNMFEKSTRNFEGLTRLHSPLLGGPRSPR